MSRKRSKGARPASVEDLSGPVLGPRGRELIALCLMGFCLFGLLSLATFDPSALDAEGIPRGGFRNLGGVVGYALASGFTFVFGLSAWLLFLSGGVAGVLFFQGRTVDKPVLKVLGIVVFAAMTSLLLAGPFGDAEATRWFPYGPGGRFGANLSPKLYAAFGGSGRLLILMFGMLCSLLLATEWLVSQLFVAGVDLVEKGARRVRLPRPAFAGFGAAPADVDATVVDRGRAAVADEEVEEQAAPRRRRRSRRAAEVEDADATAEPVAAAVGDEDEVASGIDLDLEPEDAPQAESATEEGAAEEEVTEEADDVADADTLEASSDTQDEEAAEDGDDAAEQAPVRAAGRSAGARRRRRRSRTKHPELPLFGPYPFPPLSLFRDPPESAPVQTQRFIDENKTAIEQRLASFKVEATVVDVKVGPTVTMYEVSLGEGVRVQKISTFEPDLAAALRAVSVRVVAPIPGRDTVGIEVPNKRRQMVLMRELLEKFGSSSQMAIPLFLGKDAAGEPIVEDLARMPHLLIAGTTGSGKSVCINVILLSILMTRTPQQVRLILIDPKMVELQAYKQIPHLACDVVTNMKKAPAVLEWAVDEMERRYEMLSKVGTTNISNFNKMGQAEIESRLQRPIEPTDAHLSYIVLVIDEFADLMNTAQKDVEESIQRLAQKSRAVGLHVILATQRPSANVITGVIKANLPAQIAFKVSRKLDSRVILDTNGAEKLLGHGDMLYVSPSMNQTVRAQGALVSEDEVRAVVSHIVENGPQAGAIPALVQTEKAQKLGFAQKDELYEKTVEVILSQQRGSATLIQRAFSVGYTRATRLLEMMEEDGLVGPFCGSKSRDVLMTVEEWQEREAAMEAELAAIDADDGFEDDEDFEDDEEVEATLEAEEVDEESEEDVLGGDGPGAARAVSEGEADDEEGETGDSDDEGAAAALRSSGDDASDDDEEVEDDDEEESDDEACEDEDVGADLDADASEDDDEESEDEDLAGEDELLGDDEVVFEAEEDETAEDAEDEVGEEDEVDAVWGEVDEDPDDDSDDDMEDEDSEDDDSEDEAEADAR